MPTEHLTTANSLSLVAAYGTLPVAAGLFSLLSKVAEWLGGIDAISGLRTDQETIAFFVDSATFLVLGVHDLPAPDLHEGPATAPAQRGDGRIDLGRAFHDLKEGWQFIFVNPVVRAVNVGLATGLIGGGMLVPLGPVFSIRVLGARHRRVRLLHLRDGLAAWRSAWCCCRSSSAASRRPRCSPGRSSSPVPP